LRLPYKPSIHSPFSFSFNPTNTFPTNDQRSNQFRQLYRSILFDINSPSSSSIFIQSTTTMKLLLLALSTLLAVPVAQAHMELSHPFPLRSKFDPNNSGANVDYNNMRPLARNGADFPCLGHHLSGESHTTADYVAGQSYEIEYVPCHKRFDLANNHGRIAGNAAHNGGSCQLSLSYDNGSSWRVIKSIIGNCPVQTKWGFTMPSTVPAGENILFAWSWINHTGNREMYMNCARVNVRNDNGSTASVENLPMMFTANIYGDVCQVPMNIDMIFPDPGNQVEYGKPELQGKPPTEITGCPGRPPPPQGDGDKGSGAVATSSTSLPSRIVTSSTDGGRGSPSTITIGRTATMTVTSTLSISYTTYTTISGTSTKSKSACSASTRGSASSPTPSAGCTSGQILCSDSGKAWSMCSNGKYVWMGSVAAGTECRDGKIQGAGMRGGGEECKPDGSKKCLAGGTKWAICDHGIWVDMGEVAKGTKCRDW
jgi:hypothetical protein